MIDQRRQLAEAAAQRTAAGRPLSTMRRSMARTTSNALSSGAEAAAASQRGSSWASFLLSSSVQERLDVTGEVLKLSGSGGHTWRGSTWQKRFLVLNRRKNCLSYTSKEGEADSVKNKPTDIPLAGYTSAIASSEYKRGTAGTLLLLRSGPRLTTKRGRGHRARV
jgi:hypothetical protein